ncbi:MAG: diguanylate cyclase [Sulfuricurvum sp.]|nr:diguanylate cyclase [Sulfuricurvum sp.]
MSLSSDTIISEIENNEWSQLFTSAINTQKDLIVLMYKNTPILFNKAFQNFSGISSVKEFLREFGPLHDRFVPHNSYFHTGKTDSPDEWTIALMALPEHDRIVSMFNSRTEPFAFSVGVDNCVPNYEIITFTDISQDFIKRIMIENDVSIDKESGAYDKEYFIHTSKSFHDAADFNKKAIGITMIELMSTDHEAEKFLRDFTASIKSSIRQSDMLVRWDKKTFLLAYLANTAEDVIAFSQKLLLIMRQEPFERLNAISMRMGATVQNEKEDITVIIKRAQTALEQSTNLQVTLL